METVFDVTRIRTDLSNGSCVTIGNFDGVHRGHQRLLDLLREKAHASSLPAVLLTFDPHPVQVLLGAESPVHLTTLDTRLALFERAGVDVALVVPFTREFAALSAGDFCREILVGRLFARELVIGHDFSLGKGRAGNAALLAEIGVSAGFSVEQLPPVTVDGGSISSSRIRALIGAGQVGDVPLLLGRAHVVPGTVEHGFKRGSTLLGFPTANIAPEKVILPGTGVYAAKVHLPGRHEKSCLQRPQYIGVANIGHNPTFGNADRTLEVHLLDFSRDIYGLPACVTFLQRLRDEKAFNGPAELIAQIRLDIEQTRAMIRAEQ